MLDQVSIFFFLNLVPKLTQPRIKHKEKNYIAHG